MHAPSTGRRRTAPNRERAGFGFGALRRAQSAERWLSEVMAEDRGYATYENAISGASPASRRWGLRRAITGTIAGLLVLALGSNDC
jgi:hypothetical protein